MLKLDFIQVSFLKKKLILFDHSTLEMILYYSILYIRSVTTIQHTVVSFSFLYSGRIYREF